MMPNTPPGVTVKGGRYYRIRYVGIVDGKQKREWHALTRVSDGLPAMYAALAALGAKPDGNDTRMRQRVTEWLQTALPDLSAGEQREVSRMAGEVADSFAEFATDQVQAKHILQFLQQWTAAGKRRTAQRYRALLSKFFKWVIVQGDRTDNPVDPVSVKPPAKSTVYMPDAAFVAIRAALLGTERHKTASGPMLQCYVDLLYLTGQRGKDIYSLRWADVDEQVIHFQPTKTAHSTGAKVDVQITPAIAAVLARAKQLMKDKARVSPFVIHTLQGGQYTAHGLNSAWADARKRAGIATESGYTLKNIRPKHATDAKRKGYSVEQIQQALAHADPSMTREYIKRREATIGSVNLELPNGKSGEDR